MNDQKPEFKNMRPDMSRGSRPLTSKEIHAFEEHGFVRIPGAFSPRAAKAMENRIWQALSHDHGVDRYDPGTWVGVHATGLQKLRADPVFEAIGGDTTRRAIDRILGEGRWRKPRHWGQFLISFPAVTGSWTVPSEIWHTDFDFQPRTESIFGVLLFGFISDVAPRSGGTAVMAGSPPLLRRFVESQPPEILKKMKRVRKRFLRSDPWLQELTTDTKKAGRIERFLEAPHEISGISVRITELTGKAGDVVLGHPWLLHAPTLNCGSRPRMMCVQRLHRKDGDVPEI